jgi:hypothetical protein
MTSHAAKIKLPKTLISSSILKVRVFFKAVNLWQLIIIVFYLITVNIQNPNNPVFEWWQTRGFFCPFFECLVAILFEPFQNLTENFQLA